jgi:hypothetical protein
MGHRIYLILFVTSLSLSANAGSIPLSRSASDTIDVPADGIVNVVVNGSQRALRFEMRGDGLAYPIFNPKAVAELGLRPNFFVDVLGIQAKIGSLTLAGHTAKASFSYGGVHDKRRALWFDRPIASALDGSLGPSAVPQSRVRLRIGGTGRAHSASVPLAELDGRLGVSVSVGATTIFVKFNPSRRRSVASAGAAQAIAALYKGTWSGASLLEVIDFGVERPVRELSLASPLFVAGLSVNKVLVRNSGEVTSAAEPAIGPSPDPNEIATLPGVSVTAPGQKAKSSYNLILGQDVLGACESIVFDKLSKHIELFCGQPDVSPATL